MKNKKGLVLSALITIFIIGVSIPLFMTNHKKVKADTITDLTGSSWMLNYYPTYITFEYNINFTSNNEPYVKILFEFDYLRYQDSNGNKYSVYEDDVGWDYAEYRTININGGSDATNTSFISWLQSNATMLTPPTPPTPTGTEITHRFWSSYLAMNMSTNEIIGDNNISYKVLWNQYTDEFNDENFTGLAFTGILENFDNYSYVLSPTNEDIFFKGNTNVIDNVLWLEFTTGDYIDTDLYNLMSSRGVWFDDASVYYAGTNLGSIYGYRRGLAQGQADSVEYTNLITRIFNGIGDLLSIQVFPNITIGLIIGLPLLLGVLVIIIKILRG